MRAPLAGHPPARPGRREGAGDLIGGAPPGPGRPDGGGRVRDVSPSQADRLRAGGALVLDVREPVEFAAGHLDGAVLVPLGSLANRAREALPDPDRTIVAYCATGVRSLYAAAILGQLGYREVVNLAGGIEAWQREGLPAVVPGPGESVGDGTDGGLDRVTAAQRERYSRQLLIPEVGPGGQARLLGSRVLIVGAGGLGSPAALYLAAAGVGTLEVADFDLVDVSNLQRQVLHTTDRIGEPKVDSARAAIEALNPEVTVITREVIVDAGNVAALIAGCDVVLDGTDSFETRYLLNDAAVRARVPVVHASVFRFEGQVTTFVPFEGPCYRCLYPTPPPPELAPPCSVVGVLGVVPGVMGLLQANEVLKLLLGIGEPLVARLLVFDALDSSFTELAIERDPACPACGDSVRAGLEAAATVAGR